MQLILGVLLAVAWAYNFKCWGDGIYTLQMYFKNIRNHNKNVMERDDEARKRKVKWMKVLKQVGFIALDIVAVIVVRSIIGITKDALIPSAMLGTLISFGVGAIRSNILPPYSILALIISKSKDKKHKGSPLGDIVRDHFDDDDDSSRTTVRGSTDAEVLRAGGKSYVLRNGKAYEIQH